MTAVEEPWEFLFKFIIIGNSGSGKSCLLQSFLEQKFRKNSGHTVGVEFGSKIIQVGEKRVKLQIWDTAGQERFRAVTRSYYRGSAGAILVYDISNRPSFEAAGQWLTDARDLASDQLVGVLVGNKCDNQEEREVSFLEASRFAQENDLVFLETSALHGDGVHEVFAKCTRRVLAKLADGLLDLDKITISTPGGPITRSSSSQATPAHAVRLRPFAPSAPASSCSC